MTTTRRRSRAIQPASTDWPAELADTEARAWASAAQTLAWLDAQGAEGALHQVEAYPTTAGRRVAALRAWAHTYHPSERWPNFVDQHWMNASGLRRIEQQADRAANRESLGMKETP